MKRFLISLLALMLIASTLFLCACGGGPETPTPDGGEGDGGGEGGGTSGGGDTVDVYDPSAPMVDFSAQVVNYLYPTGGLLTQPTENIYEGSASMTDDCLTKMVEAEKIIARGRPDTPLYGIYTYTHEHLANQDTVVNAGFTAARISSDSNGWTDEHQIALAETDMMIMTACSVPKLVDGKNPSASFYLPEKMGEADNRLGVNLKKITNYDLAGWLCATIEKTSEKIDRLGPEGSFWKENPNVNYNPIIYYEFFNEPNYQYLIPITRNDDGKTDDANADIKIQVYAIMQTVVYTVLNNKYGDSVKFVGISAGGGVGGLGSDYVEKIFSYNTRNNTTASELVTGYLNAALDPYGITQYVSPTDPSKNESDEDFAARQESVRKLRGYLGLADGQQMEIDIINTMDVMSTHPYMDGASPFAKFDENKDTQAKSLVEMRETMKLNSAPDDQDRAENMPIWFTECGWQLKGPKAYLEAYPEDVANGIYGGLVAEYSSKGTGTSQILQAAMEVQEYLWGIRNGIDFISFMHMYDTDGCNYGLVNYGYSGIGKTEYGSGSNDGSPRLTMYSIETMTSILPNPALLNVVHEGKVDDSKKDSPYLLVYELESDIGGEIVTTVLSPLSAAEVSIKWDADYALVTDMFGKSQIVKASGGELTLTAGPYMLYVRHVSDQMLIEHGLMADVVAESIELLSLAWNTREETI